MSATTAKASGKPSFDSVIALQSSDGNWSASAREVLARCIDGGAVEDPAVRQALSTCLAGSNQAIDEAYFTLLALFILEEAFPDKEKEWQLIADKARSYLEQAGVTNVQALVRKFSLLPIFEQ